MLLLDEPMATLDGALRQRILSFLLRVLERFQLPMLVVSHSAYELQVLCDDVIHLGNGSVVRQGRPEAVFAKSDLYAVVAREGFENVLPARIVMVGDTNCQLRLGGEGPHITAPPTRLPEGARVKVALPAADVVVSLRPVEGLSARNPLPARVLKVQDADQPALLMVRIGPDLPELAVELTFDAVADLEITPGRELYLIFKSSSLTLLG
jgi:molybdate transport system ATP-binding protein